MPDSQTRCYIGIICWNERLERVKQCRKCGRPHLFTNNYYCQKINVLIGPANSIAMQVCLRSTEPFMSSKRHCANATNTNSRNIIDYTLQRCCDAANRVQYTGLPLTDPESRSFQAEVFDELSCAAGQSLVDLLLLLVEAAPCESIHAVHSAGQVAAPSAKQFMTRDK